MVMKLRAELAVPVTCKIRCLPTEEQTLELALAI
jgi:tRNA-dihydrouridine synthase